VAKFFHFVIAVLLEELFSIKAYSSNSHVKRQDGIFGSIASYIGTVEAQGRGTLHLHIVVWLVGALTHVQMKHALKSHAFRIKIEDYIAANIRMDLEGADKDKILHMRRENALSYLRQKHLSCVQKRHNILQTASTFRCFQSGLHG
jgi:hypothetical protein